MKLLRVMFGTTTGEIIISDALQTDEGDVLLVPRWLESTTERWRTPKLAIRLPPDLLKTAPPGYPADLLLDDSLPKSVMDGRADELPAGGAYVVVAAHDIRVPRSDRRLS